MPLSLTAIVIARDAAATISQCVQALKFCNHILVGENNSVDQTAALARQAGAEVIPVAWQGYGRTKNALIAKITSGWILSVDADEVVSPELAQAIQTVLNQPGQAQAYWISRRNYFLGREIRHSGWSPDWQLRLFRAGSGWFEENPVHEALRVIKPTARLTGKLEHYSYLNLEDYIQRMNLYTTLAVAQRQAQGKKKSWARLLLDPIWTFIKMYGLQAGWKDGFAGWTLCTLSALNTLVKHGKHWEA